MGGEAVTEEYPNQRIVRQIVEAWLHWHEEHMDVPAIELPHVRYAHIAAEALKLPADDGPLAAAVGVPDQVKQRAIQAATKALSVHAEEQLLGISIRTVDVTARIAVEAAWEHLAATHTEEADDGQA